MTHRTHQMPTFTLTIVLRVALALTVLLGVAQTVAAQTTTATQAAWERKLDRAMQMQMGTDVEADATVRVTVRLGADVAAAKAQTLVALGFPVLETVDARTLVVSLSAREAMVLAEDADFEQFTLAPAATIVSSSAVTSAPTADRQ